MLVQLGLDMMSHEPQTIYFSDRGMSNPALTIWDAIMTDIHEDLEGKRFERPNNIVKAEICMDSGRAATDECTRTYTEQFVSGTVPGKCDGHKTVEICKESGKLATEYCPEVEKKTYLSTPEKEVNPAWKTNVGNKYKEITETCNIHTAETMGVTVPNVVGKTEAEAKQLLSGLKIEVVYSTDSTQPNGVVLSQSVAEGTAAKKGDAITITVNEITTTPPATEEPTTPVTNEVGENNNTVVETNTVTNTNTVM